MKKFIRIVATCLICIMMTCIFAACDNTTPPSGNGTVAQKYTVTFDANGGNFSDGESIFVMKDLSKDSIILEPITPIRTGFMFKGWSKGKYTNDFFDFDNHLALSSNLTLYAIWEESSRDEMLQTVADTMKFNYLPDKFNSSLTNSSEETLDEAEWIKQGQEIVTPEKGYSVRYKKRNAQYGFDDLSYFGANDNITYAGSLLKIDQNGNFSPIIGIKRKPMTISVGLEGVPNVDRQSAYIDNVALSNVRQGINDLVNGFVKESSELPFMVALQLTEVKSEAEINAALGLQFNARSFFNLSTSFDFKNKGSKTYAVLTLKQIYFKIDVDYSFEEGAFSLLDDSVTADQLQKACGTGYCPTYVSSISYGRIAAITIQSNKSINEISQQFNMGAGYLGISGELQENLQQTLAQEGTTYNCFVYGGATSGNQNVLNGGNLDDLVNALNQPYDPTKQIGVPISYQLSHLADSSSAKIGFVGDYYYAEFVPQIDKLPDACTEISKAFNGEYTVHDNYGDYTAYGAGYIAKLQYLSIDVSKLDLEYMKSNDLRIEITLEMMIKEVDDGYQEIYIYNAGVDKYRVQKNLDKSIASCELEHGVGKKDTSYKKYRFSAVISPDSITADSLWIAFDAWGKNEDTWRAKDISITLKETTAKTHTMYPEN